MTRTTILWHRRDLRLSDLPALTAAREEGAVIPVFIRERKVDALGAAAAWRMGLSVEAHGRELEAVGSRLVLRSGNALEVLRALVKETGAEAVYWSREYDPVCRERDAEVKAALREDGVEARSFPGKLLWEPWEVKTGQGTPYKVFSPMWKTMKGEVPGEECPRPRELAGPKSWPESEALEDWALGTAMRRGADVVAEHVCVGEAAAQQRLRDFVSDRMHNYPKGRDLLAEHWTSGLSENLTYGEISPRQCWNAAEGEGSETFRKELAWREFGWQLGFHFPRIFEREWREDWGRFPWKDDERAAEVKAWKQGRTGLDVIDAAMRELYVTGTMHNRARMIVASYLTKHMMTDWRVGQTWFADTLIDWDEASNALGWQWVAGCGPDAAPYFRIFNPASQAEKFDARGTYRERWLGSGETAASYYAAVPESWGLTPGEDRPAQPVVGLEAGRKAALAAYEDRDF
ncbi:deoxyribodipyrimidine photo-lyase [Oceanicola sp. 502str15]|uniref:cryptochrome/photolyase family protein n=1 Tax=Oceanicola sp. 502str15 TaxID=2696061 RepID=UPI002095B318|nr:deoxyribodipyrimidine photo-lyase [Oceanicola sp. 502str15]MCO6382500.1 deoxyribodipyrimidine photo-lyase [Oceanicola sp. 502str15]